MYAGLSSGRTLEDVKGLLESDSFYISHEERVAMKQAKKAEEEFRRSKGYAPDTFWSRVKRRFTKPT